MPKYLNEEQSLNFQRVCKYYAHPNFKKRAREHNKSLNPELKKLGIYIFFLLLGSRIYKTIYGRSMVETIIPKSNAMECQFPLINL